MTRCPLVAQPVVTARAHWAFGRTTSQGMKRAMTNETTTDEQPDPRIWTARKAKVERAERLELFRQQVADGSLVIRHLSPAELERYSVRTGPRVKHPNAPNPNRTGA